jgi:hypothetical protein
MVSPGYVFDPRFPYCVINIMIMVIIIAISFSFIHWAEISEIGQL